MPLFRSMRRQGRDIAALSAQPILLPHLEWFLERFLELNHYRQHGFGGAQPLAMPDVLAFADSLGVETSDRRMFLYFMRALDTVFLSWANKPKPGQGKK